MAEIADVILVIAVMLGMGVAMFASDIILNKTMAATNETQSINQSILIKGQGTIRNFDLTFAIILIGISMALFVSAFFVDQHPAFLGINILLFIIVIFISAQMSNTFMAFATSPAVIATANEYEMTIYIWQNLPTIVMIIMAMTMIVGFAKITNRRGGV